MQRHSSQQNKTGVPEMGRWEVGAGALGKKLQGSENVLGKISKYPSKIFRYC